MYQMSPKTMGSRRAKTTPLLWKLSAAIAGICAITFADAFLVNPVKDAMMVSSVSLASPTRIFSSSVAIGTAPILKSLLKKPSKVLTVGVEYSPQQADDLGDEDRSEGSLDVLSMKLRQQAKVSFIVCSDLLAIKLLSAEQKTAKGNFPGPVPIVCDGDFSHLSTMWKDLSDAGASAVVVDAGTIDALYVAESASSNGLETIWKVSTVNEAEQVLESTNEQADIFLLDIHAGNDTGEMTIPKIIEVLPKSSLSIAVLHDPMQEDGAEIKMGKEFKSMGCASVLIRKACVGDKEDIDYASFAVSELTSKASKNFKISGLTGSTNGHFGGFQSNSSVKWERTRLFGNEKVENDGEDEGKAKSKND